MPLVIVNMLEGRTIDQRRALVDNVTQAVCKSLDITPDRVQVILKDVSKTNWAKEGQLMADL